MIIGGVEDSMNSLLSALSTLVIQLAREQLPCQE